MLAWTYGYPRVMSSFYFNNNDQGPPSAGAGGGYAVVYHFLFFGKKSRRRNPSIYRQDHRRSIKTSHVIPHQAGSVNTDGQRLGKRWEMVKFRSTVAGTSASEIVTGYKQLAFARGGKGFFAINGNGGSWRKQFQTSLPSGQYCDVWSGYLKDGRCTGKTITVNNGNDASLFLYLLHNSFAGNY
ncbi:alpha amylase, all-beta domain protein, partial [Oesophagostomum dentatum]